MTTIDKPNSKQIKRLCIDFVLCYPDPEPEPMAYALKMTALWGISVDWHEFVNAIEFIKHTEM